MNISRRAVLAAALVPLTTPSKAANPWTAKFLTGAFDGKRWQAGLMLELEPGWKTYWRVPGAGGIPPDFQAVGDNLKSFQVMLPMPSRIEVNGDEIIGYEDEVVFLFAIEPIDVAKPVQVSITGFLGVCETICIPVPLKVDLTFEPQSKATVEALLLIAAQQKLPFPDKSRVTKATLDTSGPVPQLVLELLASVEDIFVECKPTTYVRKPVFSADQLEARLELAGANAVTDLTGATLRITMTEYGNGLEQMVRVV
jgi:DsbC/DsbD-like thiol-disulfide interchange protein